MPEDIMHASLSEPLDMAEYLFRRLAQVGVKSIFGLPGDYNLVALDYIPKAGLTWVGNVNELNAGYAADGYARIKGISALVTTFGVGELSALNAIAGSYSEYVPVVHIVGTPSTLAQKSGQLLHHTLGNGDFNTFATMSQNISCVTAKLHSPLDAADLIDHAVRECYVQSRPVYIALPTDMVQRKIEGARLSIPLDLSFPPNQQDQEDYVVEEVLHLIETAKKPVILVDACAIRHRALDEVHELVKKSGFPTFTAPMGKGAVDETLPNYAGVYAGNGSHQAVRNAVEGADLVLSIGAIKSDFNTTGFTYRLSQLASVDFHSDHVKVKYSEYWGLRMNGVLQKVTAQLKEPSSPASLDIKSLASAESVDVNSDIITHAWFWPQLSAWFSENDIIITETGTSGYGIWETRFKRGTSAISQILWGSIGFAHGCCAGAAIAAKELGNRRTILFTGDGSFQLTAQELSTLIRQKAPAIVFVICNNGYTIERYIHGMDASYNDIARWHYKDLVSVFDAQPGSFKTYQVRTKAEVETLLGDKEFASAPMLKFVELYMDAKDAPLPLRLTAEASAENNAKQ